MKIEINEKKNVKVVIKPWGYEKWIAPGKPNFKYALKEIYLKKGKKSSLQFHKKKEETNYILSGEGILHYSQKKINFKDFLKKGLSEKEIIKIKKGVVFHVKPFYLHRVEAKTNLLMMESSTIELDDVFRVQDDTNRKHGKIKTEHR
jgi:mannose-6-phosphate isomerase